MPRTNVPTSSIAENAGTADPTPTAGDATNDHYLDGTVDLLIRLKNTSTGTDVATFVTSYVTPGGIALADNDISCTAGQTKFVKFKGGAARKFYQQSSDSNRIYLNVGANTWEITGFGI